MKKILSIGAVLAVVSLAAWAAPENDVSWRRHPNLHEAQNFIDRAYEKIGAAQRANEFDMDGHAARARELLDQASHEIKLAAESANR